METKSIFKSKTLIINLILLITAVILLIDPSVLTSFGILPENQANVLTLLAFFGTVLNIILRFLTTGAVSINPSKNDSLPLIIGFILLSSVAMADSVVKVPFDSAALNHQITTTINSVIAAIPAPNPILQGVKIFLIGIGSYITGKFIHAFLTRNKAK